VYVACLECVECVLNRQNSFALHFGVCRMCSLQIECVLSSFWTVHVACLGFGYTTLHKIILFYKRGHAVMMPVSYL
jgi:hypothetical protein